MIEAGPIEPLVYTKKGAARALLISERSLDRALQRGEVRFQRYGRLVRISRAEVERLAKEGLAAEAR